MSNKLQSAIDYTKIINRKILSIKSKINSEVFDVQKRDMVEKLAGHSIQEGTIGPIQFTVGFYNIWSRYKQIIQSLLNLFEYLDRDEKPILTRFDVDYICFWLSHPNRKEHDKLSGFLEVSFPLVKTSDSYFLCQLVSRYLDETFSHLFLEILSLRIPRGCHWLPSKLLDLTNNCLQMLKSQERDSGKELYLYKGLEDLYLFMGEKLFLLIREYDLTCFDFYTISNKLD